MSATGTGYVVIEDSKFIDFTTSALELHPTHSVLLCSVLFQNFQGPHGNTSAIAVKHITELRLDSVTFNGFSACRVLDASELTSASGTM
jgi:hypothetical protein